MSRAPHTGPTRWLDSPIGGLLLRGDGTHLVAIDFDAEPSDAATSDDAVLVEADRQLTAYFAGDLTEFDLPLGAGGTPFQRRVWDLLVTIPFGATTSYGAIAAQLGLPPGASRAVGSANGSNPIPVVVPCHRVIGSSGKLTGYAGGLARKQTLLDLESPALF
ncbi:methylated-DNA--[protein]-cysteine S-methyltransferase [Solicola sp. PLA-1-18]|uniref:methylated-DNA--[protein]-cysteine S-methyltransferase n=1 Tax=Solicola sp. PLA-1-18 TaxID=3380532 RepID=UPI003B81DF05